MADKKGGAKGGAKGAPAKTAAGKRGLYKIEGGKLVRARKACPKCGPGVFLAEHKDRTSCGNCGYTEFKAKAA
ncbi:MAG TPA: 30S ribosomal protein S27ae [Candidatus Thermoplasmatota archaeon]|nr:30S ribosomal protein S27ae [Candidatus Thermoplasmatota archaeon]HVL86764.1 30S ribosomal protein S27ae [Candidatus Thermoplasmatota archaeon]